MILVQILCKVDKCRKVLAAIEHRPETWEGVLEFKVCGRHTPQAMRSGLDFFRWADAQHRAGRPGPPFMMTLAQTVPWSQLRPAIEEAERLGRTVIERA